MDNNARLEQGAKIDLFRTRGLAGLFSSLNQEFLLFLMEECQEPLYMLCVSTPCTTAARSVFKVIVSSEDSSLSSH